MRVLVTGSRDWVDSDRIWAALYSVLDTEVRVGDAMIVVHGNARGADSIANQWAIERSHDGCDVEPEAHPAQWTKHGRLAGPLRNQEMVDAGADLVLAFIKDNSPGASHLVRQARKAGIPVEEFRTTTEVDMTEVAGETVTTTPPTLVERLVAVKREIGAVGKGDRNSQQGFNFRGIDAVLNAVAGPLMKHGVMVYPSLQSLDKGTATTTKGSVMNTVVVTVCYVFTDGHSQIAVTVPGEAFDSGDKCVAKAMSVAYRTALIQALSLPTDEPDPDSVSYEAAPHVRQMSDAELTAAIEAETSLVDLQAMWSAQGLSARSKELQDAMKKRAAALQEPSA